MALGSPPDEVRELRLEGFTLWFAGGVLAAALVGAFALGRWVGASSAPSTAGRVGAAPAASTPEDAAEDLSFFDTLSGPGKQAEPSREAAAPERTPSSPAIAPASPGSWFVQIGALRDRQAAEVLVRSLGAKGYRLRVDTEREGARGVLYKVRVGGYPSREAADAAAARLRQDGQGGAFVARVD